MAADSKTEKATPKKRRDERKEGNVFMSTDVVNVVFVFASFYILSLLFPFIHSSMGEFTKHFIALSGSITTLNNADVSKLGMQILWVGAKTILPFALVCMLLGVLMHGIQTRFLFTGKNVFPKLNRISPLQGIKKMFSLKNGIELLKNFIKITILVSILFGLLKEDARNVIRTMDMSIETSSVYMFSMVMSIIIRVSLVFAFIAFFDYLFQRWDYERKIRMSKQEMKEEYKQTEGDPQLKGRIRELQKQRAKMRMMQAVPEADVIIRNPTHYAVALAYDMEKHKAPIVLAKGKDELALRIVKTGEEHEVVIIEDKPLARGLYAQVEVNKEVPMEYYGVVAEILVYVYKINKKMR